MYTFTFNLGSCLCSCHEFGEAEALPALLCDGEFHTYSSSEPSCTCWSDAEMSSFSDRVLHLLYKDHSHSAQSHDALPVAVVL